MNMTAVPVLAEPVKRNRIASGVMKGEAREAPIVTLQGGAIRKQSATLAAAVSGFYEH